MDFLIIYLTLGADFLLKRNLSVDKIPVKMEISAQAQFFTPQLFHME